MVRKIHIKESNESRKWVNTELPKADWEKLRKFVKEQGYKYEASGAGNLVHVEMYLSSDEIKKVDDVIDQIDAGTYESYNRRNKSYIKENAIVDDTDAHDDYIYYLEKKLNRIKSVDKLRKTLEEQGFTQTDGIDYNTWDNYYGDDASFDTWEKDDVVVQFWYDEKYRAIETRVW